MNKKIINPQEYQREGIEKCFIEAFNTYEDYIIEHAEDLDIGDEAIEDAMGDLHYKLVEAHVYEEILMKAKDLHEFTPLHTLEYDLSDGIPENINKGAIIVARTENKTLIIDGNHRRNTLINHCPEQTVLVIIVDCFIP